MASEGIVWVPAKARELDEVERAVVDIAAPYILKLLASVGPSDIDRAAEEGVDVMARAKEDQEASKLIRLLVSVWPFASAHARRLAKEPGRYVEYFIEAHLARHRPDLAEKFRNSSRARAWLLDNAKRIAEAILAG